MTEKVPDEESVNYSETASELNLNANLDHIKNSLTVAGISRATFAILSSLPRRNRSLRSSQFSPKASSRQEHRPLRIRAQMESPNDTLSYNHPPLCWRGHSVSFSFFLSIYASNMWCFWGVWDQTGSNGADLTFPQEFGIPTDASSPHAARNTWIVGVVNPARYIRSAACSCWLSDSLNSYLGRRGAIFITVLIIISIPTAYGFTHNLKTSLIVPLGPRYWNGRKGSLLAFYLSYCLVEILNCLSIGSTNPIYGRWKSPRTNQWCACQWLAALGTFKMCHELLPRGYPQSFFIDRFWYLIRFSADIIFDNTGEIVWHLQLSSAFIPAVPLVVGISSALPPWLTKKNRYTDPYYVPVKGHSKLPATSTISMSNLLRKARLFAPPTFFRL
ncbi:hypothetical protein PILCRDRAFT_14772 [Piloderma croceum F 1598]|uniref:Uncharacterized protein n=1 Tax=Piloderma croceum (strain F 1598) TaxID=765440 RepID=A0A0C3AJM6_PILCF|nr:hypothetical protein PILCRDRAFT_14772 [Piloderma croceum F 1598]